MTYQSAQPDPAARWLSHLLVGYLATKLLKGVNGFVALVGAILFHEWLDAPVARAVTAGGL